MVSTDFWSFVLPLVYTNLANSDVSVAKQVCRRWNTIVSFYLFPPNASILAPQLQLGEDCTCASPLNALQYPADTMTDSLLRYGAAAQSLLPESGKKKVTRLYHSWDKHYLETCADLRDKLVLLLPQVDVSQADMLRRVLRQASNAGRMARVDDEKDNEAIFKQDLNRKSECICDIENIVDQSPIREGIHSNSDNTEKRPDEIYESSRPGDDNDREGTHDRLESRQGSSFFSFDGARSGYVRERMVTRCAHVANILLLPEMNTLREFYFYSCPECGQPEKCTTSKGDPFLVVSVGGALGFEAVGLNVMLQYMPLPVCYHKSIRVSSYDLEIGWEKDAQALDKILKAEKATKGINSSVCFNKGDICLGLRENRKLYHEILEGKVNLVLFAFVVVENALALEKSDFVFFREMFAVVPPSSTILFMDSGDCMWTLLLQLARAACASEDSSVANIFEKGLGCKYTFEAVFPKTSGCPNAMMLHKYCTVDHDTCRHVRGSRPFFSALAKPYPLDCTKGCEVVESTKRPVPKRLERRLVLTESEMMFRLKGHGSSVLREALSNLKIGKQFACT